jgi:hypothetical protein
LPQLALYFQKAPPSTRREAKGLQVFDNRIFFHAPAARVCPAWGGFPSRSRLSAGFKARSQPLTQFKHLF